MDKTIRLGTGPYGSTFCRIKLNDGKLSIVGVEGPKRNGDAHAYARGIRFQDERVALERQAGLILDMAD